MSGHEIMLGDCLAGMKEMEAGSVGCVITDPPYSEHTHAKVRRGGSFHAPDVTTGGPRRPVISTSVVLGFDSLDAETRAAAAEEMARVARRWIVVFSDVESVHLWQRDLVAVSVEHVRIGAWAKEGATPQFTGDRPGIGFEAIEIAHRSGRKRWNGGGRHGLWTYPIESGKRIHTTQKPLPLMEALVRDFTDPGELVLDPFAGSGTTGVACKRLGRRFLGFERDPKFHAAAVKRLANASQQYEFAPRPAKPKQSPLFSAKPDTEGAKPSPSEDA